MRSRDGAWGYYDTAAELDQLTQALCPKGKREKALLERLTKATESLKARLSVPEELMEDVSEAKQAGLIFEDGLTLEVAADRALWFERKRPDVKGPEAL